MTGANFSLLVARMARVRGRALNSQGEPVARAMLMLAPADPSQMSFEHEQRDGQARRRRSSSRTCAPGRYNLNVRPMRMQDATSEFAVLPITVGNDDIDNVLVTTSLGAIARGVDRQRRRLAAVVPARTGADLAASRPSR